MIPCTTLLILFAMLYALPLTAGLNETPNPFLLRVGQPNGCCLQRHRIVKPDFGVLRGLRVINPPRDHLCAGQVRGAPQRGIRVTNDAVSATPFFERGGLRLGSNRRCHFARRRTWRPKWPRCASRCKP